MASKRSRTAFEADLQKRDSPYAFYGTPLPPLDDHARDDGSYVPVWKQEVTDDRGRKRLHGAFTGGFSAGYYNTVGSKEGWTPATFVSSRQKRMRDAKEVSQQRPEDFMDEEDLREAEEARILSTSDGFAGFGSTQSDAMRSGGLMDILRVTGDTVGVRLLKKMGWREGQGIGPKVRRAARADNGEDLSDETHMFAPEDPQMISFPRKTNNKGLGYAGEARLTSSSRDTAAKTLATNSDDEEDNGMGSATSLNQKSAKRHSKQGGFGVGILDDTGSDDEDPYQMGPKISHSKVLGGNRKTEKKKRSTLGAANPLLTAKPVFISKKLTGARKVGFRKCHDGRLPPEGFVLSNELDAFSSISLQDDKYKPPEVPPDWKSSRTRKEDTIRSPYTSSAEAAKASSLDAPSRSKMLGEEQLPGKSIFDYMSQSARERIAAASGKRDLPAARGEKAPEGYEASREDRLKQDEAAVPRLDAEVALQALARGASGWMPYAEDEAKRTRYRTYLERQAGTRDVLPTRAESVNRNDWVNELHEFARAAQMFRPVNGLMASRFTSASSQPTGSRDTSGSGPTDSLLTKPAAKPEDPAEAAAKLGMFGPLTRSVQNFYPTRLLCKRFNVKAPAIVQPEPGEGPAEQNASRATSLQSYNLQKSSDQDFNLDSKGAGGQLRLESGPTVPQGQEEQGGSIEQTTLVIDADRNDALEAEKPGQAVFKAIFGSDDEDG